MTGARSMTPFRITLALVLVMVAVLLAAGCENQERYEENHDIIVIRLTRDGTLAWISTIDSGIDNTANDIVQLPDGSFLIAGSIRHEQCKPHYGLCKIHPRIIHLSDNGTIVWDTSLNGSTHDEVLRIFLDPDGNFTVVTQNGTLWSLTSSGISVSSRPTGIVVFESPEIIRTSDKGYAVLTPFFPPRLSKLDPAGNISWIKKYDNQSINEVLSIAEMKNGEGYLIAGFESRYLRGGGNVVLIRTTPEGAIVSKTSLDKKTESINPIIEPLSEGYRVRYRIDLFTRGNYVYTRQNIVNLGSDGNVINYSVIDATKTTVVTREGDYCFAGFYSPTALTNLYADHVAEIGTNHEFYAIRLGKDGARLWEYRIPNISVSSPMKIIQTSEGGFTILAIHDEKGNSNN